ncbi:restriction endonuclease subunit S [Campylobacter devanensis]|uniref:restriction endonuclease subunit S n=1 Tax=Campylobacter devanensis TaxID=3161138 RepID=UPI0015D79A4C|nr:MULTISPECIES: restriction endonuclease subunit S [unclassified Campylobacter]
MAKIKKDTNLRKSILQAAITGQLISNVKGETKTGKELLDKIIEERNAKLLADWEEAKKKNPKAKKPTPIVASEITEDEIPFEIPKSWCWCRLGNLGTFINGDRGSNYPSKYKLSSNGEIPFVSAINFENTTLRKDNLLYVSQNQYDLLRSGKLQKEDFAICIRGSLGKFCFYPLEVGAIASSLVILRANEIINKKYLYYYLCSNFFYEEIKRFNNGTAQPNLAAGDLIKFLFPLPPLAVQNAIVAKLEEVLPLVDAYENAVLQKEELKTALPDKVKKAILQEAIQGKLTKSWRKTTTIEESGKQLLDRIIEERNAKLLADWEEAKKKNPKAKKPAPIAASEITEDEIPFEIPKSWCWCRLGEICKLTDGEKIQDIKLPLLDAKYLRGKKEAEYISSGKLAKPNDLLILVDGENSGEVFINKEEGIMGSTFKKLNIVNELYLPYVLQFIALNKDLLRNSKKGAAIPHLNKDIFFGLLLPLPPLAEQEKIVEIIEQILPLCEKLGG